MGKVMGALEALELINDGDCVWIVSSGGGVNEPHYLLEQLEQLYFNKGHPNDLVLCHSSGIGDKNGGGSERFSHKGMVRKVIASHWPWSPKMQQMALNDEFEAYILPQGVMVQLVREIAGGRPGLISHVGLHTFIDPRVEGGAVNHVSKDSLSEVYSVNGKEYLFYKSFPIQVTILRASTADEEGNLSFEQEGVVLEALSAAQAAKNSKGVVLAQVRQVVKAGTLNPLAVRVPGLLVDAIIVDREQRQSYLTSYNPSFSGECQKEQSKKLETLPLTERKIIARRAAMELKSGYSVNLGFGIPAGIASIANEEGCGDDITLTVEQGSIGGIPAGGSDFGLSYRPRAIIEEPYQFDWYDGGGLDIAFLSFAQIDKYGNVNVSRFGNRLIGVGGFINISQNAKTVVFMGTFTTEGLKETFMNGISIEEEGKTKKFVDEVEQISFSADYARQCGQKVLYVTERAVFRLAENGVELLEVAPGINTERDVIGQMGFVPSISALCKGMDLRIFGEGCIGLREKLEEKG